MLSRRDALRGGTASLAAIAVTGAAAAAVPGIAESATSRDMPAADGPLFEAIRAFHAVYEPTKIASEVRHTQWEEVMALAERRGLEPSSKEFNAFFDEHIDRGLCKASNRAWNRTGRCANAVFSIPAQTLRGAIEKLKIVRLAVGANGDGTDADEDLDVFQDYDDPWFDQVLADLERLAGEA